MLAEEMKRKSRAREGHGSVSILNPAELEVERKRRDESTNGSEEALEYAKKITVELGAVKQTTAAGHQPL
jgi:hypothetical protein